MPPVLFPGNKMKPAVWRLTSRVGRMLMLALFAATVALPCIASVIDEDDRRTEQQFADENKLTLEAVQARFAASGEIRCGPWFGSANLTYKENIITTSAHIFADSTSCKATAKAATCKFLVSDRGITREYKIKSLSAQGFRCPATPRPVDDWAVLILDRPVDGVSPYSIDWESQKPVAPGDKVLAVGLGGIDFPIVIQNNQRSNHTNAIGRCRIRATVGEGSIKNVASDCDGSQGASGGAMLKEHNNGLSLVAIRKSGPETQALVQRAKETGVANRGQFNKDTWASYYVPVVGRFRDAIKAATGERPQ